MTVLSDPIDKVSDGDGVTTAFPYTGRNADPNDIFCYIIAPNGARRIPSYTVTGDGNGVTVTITSEVPQVGDKVVRFRDTLLRQDVNYEGGNFPSSTHENNADKLMMASQDRRATEGRSLRLRRGAAAIPELEPFSAPGLAMVSTPEGGFGEGPAATEIANAQAYALDAQGWAESVTEPGAPGTKSAKTWAGLSGGYSDAAEAARDAAQSAQTMAEVILDSFDDSYLGAKAADPALDNDGDPLVVGALYYNTTENEMRIYDSVNWAAVSAGIELALKKANNLSDLSNLLTARANLELIKQTARDDFTAGRMVVMEGARGAALAQFGGNYSASTLDIDAVDAGFSGLVSTTNAGTIPSGGGSFFYLECQAAFSGAAVIQTATFGYAGSGTPSETKIFIRQRANSGGVWGAWQRLVVAPEADNGGWNYHPLGAVGTTAGTVYDFTGIPAWANEIKLIFRGVSLTGNSYGLVQVGAGAIADTGYASASGGITGANLCTFDTATNGFVIFNNNAASYFDGEMMLMRTAPLANSWVASHAIGRGAFGVSQGGGDTTLGGALDRVRLTRVGAHTFDTGNISVAWRR